MKIKMTGCVITVCLVLWQFAGATANADSAITASSNITPAINTVETARNPFSGEQQSSTRMVVNPPVLNAIPPKPVMTMALNSGDLLSQGVKAWAEKKGYKLLWQSKNDYLIYNQIIIDGVSDDEILVELGELFASENYGLIIKNYQKNRVLLVDDM